MDTLTTQQYIIKKYSLDLEQTSPINIADVGRVDLACLFSELGFKKGVEIGTEQGVYAEILCKTNPKLHLYCVDPWKVYEGNLGYHIGVTQQQFDLFYKESKKRLSSHKATLIRKMSTSAVKRFRDDSLDFVYIDGNHRLEYVISDIAEWTKKVRPGGIVAGHDYIKYKHQHFSHIVEAVIAYNESYRRGLPWFILDSKKGDKFRSWFFIK